MAAANVAGSAAAGVLIMLFEAERTPRHGLCPEAVRAVSIWMRFRRQPAALAVVMAPAGPVSCAQQWVTGLEGLKRKAASAYAAAGWREGRFQPLHHR